MGTWTKSITLACSTIHLDCSMTNLARVIRSREEDKGVKDQLWPHPKAHWIDIVFVYLTNIVLECYIAQH